MSAAVWTSLHTQRKAGFDRFEADVQKEKLILSDGTHYTQHGYEMLAAAVADSILGSLK